MPRRSFAVLMLLAIGEGTGCHRVRTVGRITDQSSVPQQDPDTRTGTTDSFLRWAASNARALTPLDDVGSANDLAPIDRIAKHARIIAVGESNHNVHEFLRVRHRILQHLAERGAIAAVAMETGLPEARALDAWLAGDSREAPPFERVLHYGYGRDVEMRDMLAWLHDYNAQLPRARRIHFYGIDMARNGGGSFLPALEPVWAYLDRVDPSYAGQSRARVEAIVRSLDRPAWQTSRPAYDSLSTGDRDLLRIYAAALAERFVTSRDTYLTRSGPEDYAWAARLAEVVRQTGVYLRERDGPANVRDVGMAENLQWVLARENRRGRVLLFAHNLHIARAPIEGPMVVARFGHPAQVQTLGRLLGASLGAAYATIGTAHDLGAERAETTPADPTSVDGVLARVGPAQFLLNLHERRMPADARTWLLTPHLMRAVSMYVEVRLAEAYDAIIFIKKIRRADQTADSSSIGGMLPGAAPSRAD